MRRILKMCYMITMILTACNSGGDEVQKVTLGRYIEKVSSFPETEDMVWLNQTLEGKVQIYQQGETLKLYEQQEDGSLLEIHNEGLDEFNKKYPSAWISAVTTDKEGNIYLAHIDCSNTDEGGLPKGTNIIKLNETGMTVSPLHIEGDLNYIVPLQIMILANGDALIYENEVQRFSLETGMAIKNYGEIEGRNILLMDQQFYTLNFSENQIDVYNIESGQIENHIACSGALDESALLVKGDGKDLYMVSPEGITHLAEGGTIWEEIVSGNGLSLSLPSQFIEEVTYSNKKFIARFSTPEYMTRIREYVYSATTPSKPTQEINIYALEESKIVQESVNSYQLDHPEIRINMEYGMDEIGNISRADAIKALNAELLAGTGPDLIVMDGLDIEGYREKGLLVDLSDMIDKKKYMTSIINCFTKEEITYGIPLRFTVPTLWGDEEVLKEVNSIEEIASCQKKHSDIKVYNDMTASTLFKQWVTLEEEKWFDENGDLKVAELTGFLEAVKKVAVPKEKEEEIGTGYSGLLEVYGNEVEMYEEDMGSMQSLLLSAAAIGGEQNNSFKILEINGEKVFKPNGIISINKNSQKQEMAEDILTYMLEESQQLIDIKGGFPVHLEAMEAWIKGENYNKDTVFVIGNDVAKLYAIWGNEATLEAFYKEIQGTTKAVLGDKMLTEMVLEAAKPYFEGTMTIEEVINDLKPRLELYMNE